MTKAELLKELEKCPEGRIQVAIEYETGEIVFRDMDFVTPDDSPCSLINVTI
jgi:hypothetical protein